MKNFFQIELNEAQEIQAIDRTLRRIALDEKTENLSYDLQAYQQCFENAFYVYQQQNWPSAIKLFEQCRVIKPADKVALIFISRCQLLAKTPPTADWDGVWRLTEK